MNGRSDDTRNCSTNKKTQQINVAFFVFNADFT